MRSTTQNNSLYQSMILGIVLSIATTVLLAALGAVFIDNKTFGVEGMRYISCAILALSSFLCTFVSGRNGGEKWLVRSSLGVFVYYLILIIVGSLLFDGVTESVTYGLIAGLCGFSLAVFGISRQQIKPKSRRMRSLRVR